MSLEKLHLMNINVIIPKSTSIFFFILLAVLPIESTIFANNFFKVNTLH